MKVKFQSSYLYKLLPSACTNFLFVIFKLFFIFKEVSPNCTNFRLHQIWVYLCLYLFSAEFNKMVINSGVISPVTYLPYDKANSGGGG